MPDLAEALAADRAKAFAMADVSRETADRLDRFVGLLLEWQRKVNLISASSVASIWTRHVADSLQLVPLGPNRLKSVGPVWADLGSGAGFPGLVIACALADVQGAHVHLIESIGKKAAFLTEAVRATGVPATIHPLRIEMVARRLAPSLDVVTARALAPLYELFAIVAPIVQSGAQAVLPKGQHLEAELTEVTKYWNIKANIVPSKTSATGKILIVQELSRRKGAPVRASG